MQIKVSLNLSERYRVLTLLNDFKGSLDSVALASEDAKKTRIEDEEWEKGDRKITTAKDENGQDMVQWKWDDEKGGEKEIEFNVETITYLKNTIEKKDKDGEVSMRDLVFIGLFKKLK